MKEIIKKKKGKSIEEWSRSRKFGAIKSRMMENGQREKTSIIVIVV